MHILRRVAGASPYAPAHVPATATLLGFSLLGLPFIFSSAAAAQSVDGSTNSIKSPRTRFQSAAPQTPATDAAPTTDDAGVRGLLFVTQPPIADDFATANSVFGNHRADVYSTPRGGDLYIRYEDGAVRNLTQEAGFGLAQYQEISVREPSPHYTGTRALFCMAIGGTKPNDITPVKWQIYEISGLKKGQQAKVVKVPQPSDSNNVSPFYGSDDRILFTSDRPRDNNKPIGPHLDEYEMTPSNSGIWSMRPDGSDLKLLDHAPSGDFTPILASDGRIIFTRWDHLQRDQLWYDGQMNYGAYDMVSEGSTAKMPVPLDQFPEPLSDNPDGIHLSHHFNHFFPWQMNEDGSGLETLNHVGRHELLAYFPGATNLLPSFYDPTQKTINGLFLQIKEDPTKPGRFYGTTATEFNTHGAGQIVRLDAPIGKNADDMEVEWVTDPISLDPIPSTQTPPPNFNGHFRNPVPLSNGSLIAVRTSAAPKDKVVGPGPLYALYDFHLSWLTQQGTYFSPAGRVIPTPFVKSISYYSNFVQQTISYSGALWELDPVEIFPRTRPGVQTEAIADIEMNVLKQELRGTQGVKKLQDYLKQNRLALLVSRDVTRRGDKQQEFNLKVADSTHQTAMPGSTPTEIGFLQFLQGDMIRGYTTYSQTVGRRVVARPMHNAVNPAPVGSPKGSVKIADDGSIAAFVPAGRALTWQLTQPDGTPLVRERYWVTFAPGEIRTCTNCHGINKADVVLGLPAPTNEPKALHQLMQWYKDSTNAGSTGTTIGVYSPSSALSFLRQLNSAGPADAYFNTGLPAGWQLIQGDWDGDGVTTFGAYDPAASKFYLNNALGAAQGPIQFVFGTPNSGAIAVVGDWDGDGSKTVGLYLPSTGSFLLTNVNAAGPPEMSFNFGPVGALPLAGNWDGAFGDSVGVFLQSTGEYWLRNQNGAGAPDVKATIGLVTGSWIPIVGDWDGDGVDTIGAYRRSDGRFLLRNINSSGAAQIDFNFGPIPGGQPLAGDWNGGAH